VFDESCEAVFAHVVCKHSMPFAWFHAGYINAFSGSARLFFFYLPAYFNRLLLSKDFLFEVEVGGLNRQLIFSTMYFL
jgi:hypothetical protein